MKIAERRISDYLSQSKKLTLTLHCISVAIEDIFKERSDVLAKVIAIQNPRLDFQKTHAEL